MQRRFFKLSLAVAASAVIASSAFGDELKDAIECEQFVAMSARQLPPGHPAEAEASSLLGAWTVHVRLLSGDADTLAEDRTAASQAIFNVVFNNDATEKQAYMASLQRCRTAPVIEEMVYPASTCGAFALHAEDHADSTAHFQDAKSAGFKAEGEDGKAAVAQELADDAREVVRLSNLVRTAFFDQTPRPRVEPNAFGVFDERRLALLRSCAASMGLEG